MRIYTVLHIHNQKGALFPLLLCACTSVSLSLALKNTTSTVRRIESFSFLSLLCRRSLAREPMSVHFEYLPLSRLHLTRIQWCFGDAVAEQHVLARHRLRAAKWPITCSYTQLREWIDQSARCSHKSRLFNFLAGSRYRELSTGCRNHW